MICRDIGRSPIVDEAVCDPIFGTPIA